MPNIRLVELIHTGQTMVHQNRSLFKQLLRLPILFVLFFCLCGCEANKVIVNNLEEREANEIVVFLASKGIPADKVQMTSNAPGGGESAVKWSIAVPPDQSTDAMALLNQNGLPRIKGTNLLDLFAKAGLMSSEKEETIRYQAGLAEQIANMIRKIDGVIDADVQLSFPPAEANAMGAATQAPASKDHGCCLCKTSRDIGRS